MSTAELFRLDDAGDLQLSDLLYECAVGRMWIDTVNFIATRIRMTEETFSILALIT